MTDLEAVKAIRKLLAHESRWTYDAYARDSDGANCDPNSRKATCWCAIGALAKVQGKDINIFGLACLDKLAVEQGFLSLAHLNDSSLTNHASLLSFLDLAISRLEAQS